MSGTPLASPGGERGSRGGLISPLEARDARGCRVTRLGLGGAQFGNLFREMSLDTARATFAAAWEGGIRYVDTAPHYGLGLSERRLGTLLRGHPRDSYVLSTKVGRLLVPNPGGEGRSDDEGFAVPATTRREWDFSRDGVRRSVEASLERLGLDRIDIAYLHDPENHWEQATREGLPALLELREEGAVRAVGAGMNLAEPLTELVEHHDVDLVMCAGRYTLLEQAHGLLETARRRGVGVVVAGVYNSGLLARPRPATDARYNYEPAPAALLERVGAIAEICEAHGVSLPDAALAFPLRHPAVVSAVVGAGTPAQVEAALRAVQRPVPESLWSDLASSGLLATAG
jgi:D-threo-aldose 1-dehydrogenase